MRNSYSDVMLFALISNERSTRRQSRGGGLRVASYSWEGPCRVWIKVRNPASVAMQRELEQLIPL
jgi:hypothetical protein